MDVARRSGLLLALGATLVPTGVAALERFPIFGVAMVATGCAIFTWEIVEVYGWRKHVSRHQRILGVLAIAFLAATIGHLSARWQYKPDYTAQEIENRARTPLVNRLKEREQYETRLKEELQQTKDVSQSLAIREFGGNFKFYRRWNPYQDRNETIALGACGGVECPVLTLLSIGGTGPDSFVSVRMVAPYLGSVVGQIPLREGCHRELLNAKGYALQIIVEDDSIQNPVLGVVFVRRPMREPPPAEARYSYPPDWTDAMAWVMPRAQITCGDEVHVCNKINDTDIEDAAACWTIERRPDQ